MAKKKDLETAPSPAKPDDRDYEAESALDTIMRAEEHKADEKMMERVKKHAGRKVKALDGLHKVLGTVKDEPRSTDDLRKIRNKKAMGSMG